MKHVSETGPLRTINEAPKNQHRWAPSNVKQQKWLTEVLHMYRRSLQGKYPLAQLWTLASRYLWAFNPFWTPLNLLDISSPVYFKSLSFSLIQWYRMHIVKYFKIPCYHTLLLIKTNSKCHRLIYKCGTKCPQIFLTEVNHSTPICTPDFFSFFAWEEMLSF